jgi:REP element-mobilizing transposase RayT
LHVARIARGPGIVAFRPSPLDTTQKLSPPTCQFRRLELLLPSFMSRRDPILTRQLSLDLRARTHGGARPGAGGPRKPASARRPVAHRTRASHRKGDPVHVTVKVGRGVPSLRSQLLARHVKQVLLKQREKLEAEASAGVAVGKCFQVVHFTIQDDHMHLIVEATDKRMLARGVMGLEIRIARSINKLLKRTGRFWAERYHRRDLRTPTETRNVLRYVLLNLQKHYRGFGDRAFADPKSSAASFDGYSRPPLLLDDAERWPHVTPRTWLLGVGWRYRGLLDPADTPPSSPYRPLNAQ